jgi:hypothetical protein
MYLEDWGPLAWHLFHSITYTYSIKLKKNYIFFFKNLYKLIPCPYCSKDIKNIINDNINDNIFENKNKLIEWFIDIHNKVNIKLKKKKLFNKSEVDKLYIKSNHININYEKINKYILFIIDVINHNILQDIFTELLIVFPYNNNKISINLINYFKNNFFYDKKRLIEIINNDINKLNKLKNKEDINIKELNLDLSNKFVLNKENNILLKNKIINVKKKDIKLIIFNRVNYFIYEKIFRNIGNQNKGYLRIKYRIFNSKNNYVNIILLDKNKKIINKKYNNKSVDDNIPFNINSSNNLKIIFNSYNNLNANISIEKLYIQSNILLY